MSAKYVMYENGRYHTSGEGGGGNCFSPFVDYTNVIQARTVVNYNQIETYTAIQDCALVVSLIRYQNGRSNVSVDGVTVAGGFSSSTIVEVYVIYLKAGQTASIFSDASGDPSSFIVYGLTSGSLHNYSTTEQVVGTWADGKPVYETTYIFQSDIRINASSWTDTPISNSGIKRIISCDTSNLQGTFWQVLGAAIDTGDYIRFFNGRNNQYIDVGIVVLRYTKTTD